ncbi:MAG: DUF2080 family transposase-associated protein [Deltaproteobacteria bacterium]|nr:DUF2080 family transposase-associated protein [Deltaproteobacteria bacterium]
MKHPPLSPPGGNEPPAPGVPAPVKARFVSYGEEMIEKEVKQSGPSGRIYLPPEWVGKKVKIIRLD